MRGLFFGFSIRRKRNIHVKSILKHITKNKSFGVKKIRGRESGNGSARDKWDSEIG
jgi:hypothetical protein